MHFNPRATHGIIALALALATSFASGALADTQSDKIGNSSGTKFESHCPPGQVMVGWAYNYGDVLLAIGPACQNVVNGALSGAPDVARDTVAGSSTSAAGSESYACKPEYGAVQTVSVMTADNLRIVALRATCRNLVGSGKGGSSISPPTKTTGAVAVAAKSGIGCGTGSHATGMYGSYVDGGPRPGIQSIGLFCRVDGQDDIALPPQNADTGDDQGDNDQANLDTGNGNDDGNGDGNGNGITINGLPFQIQINLGPGQNGISFGPKGKIRVATDDTTVYSDKGNTEIAYLAKGQKVQVIGCEKKGKGWCQIVKPTPGLVWGGDLK